MWVWGVCFLLLSALLSKVCPVTQDTHQQPLFLLSVFVSAFPKMERNIFLFYFYKTLWLFWMDSALGDFSITVIVKSVVSLSPNTEDKYLGGGAGFQVDKRGKTAYWNYNYALLSLQITAKMSVFFLIEQSGWLMDDVYLQLKLLQCWQLSIYVEQGNQYECSFITNVNYLIFSSLQ